MEFGETAGIPQAGDTRWNSTFIQLLRIEKLDQKKLNKALDASKHTVAKLTPRELEQLKDFLKILNPFYEITQKTQGEKVSLKCCSVFVGIRCVDHVKLRYTCISKI